MKKVIICFAAIVVAFALAYFSVAFVTDTYNTPEMGTGNRFTIMWIGLMASIVLIPAGLTLTDD